MVPAQTKDCRHALPPELARLKAVCTRETSRFLLYLSVQLKRGNIEESMEIAGGILEPDLS